MDTPFEPHTPIDSPHALAVELEEMIDLSPQGRQARWSRLAVEIFRAIENGDLNASQLPDMAAMMTDAWAD